MRQKKLTTTSFQLFRAETPIKKIQHVKIASNGSNITIDEDFIMQWKSPQLPDPKTLPIQFDPQRDGN